MEDGELQLVRAERVPLSQRVAIMNAAYSDYLVPTHVTQEQMLLMDQCFDINAAHSVVARTRWESVGLALLAQRTDRGWISGVGVVPDWRRRGVGRAMMEWLADEARQMGISRLSLEVISANAPARRLYSSLGYREERELLTWQRPSTADPLPIPNERLAQASIAELLAYHLPWHDQPACWQRERSSLGRMANRLRGYRLDLQSVPGAYCMVGGGADGAVALVDVGINPEVGLLMPGRVLLQALAALHRGTALSIMNVPADDSLNRILAALGFHVTLRQLEMVLDP